jgi:hypothetical protein
LSRAAPILPCGGGFSNQDRKMEKQIFKMKEYAVIKNALRIYVATLSEEYDAKQTRYGLSKLTEAQRVFEEFKRIGKNATSTPNAS